MSSPVDPTNTPAPSNGGTATNRDPQRSQPSAPAPQRPAPAAPAADLPDAPDQPGGTRTAGLWISMILGAILLILLLVFVVQNNIPQVFQFISWRFSLPLGVAMLLAAIAGALLMALVGSVRMFQMSRSLKKHRKYVEQIRKSTTSH